MDWLAANRDLEGDGLLWIVQPDESGLDASPKFEPVWGRRANGADRLPAAGPPQPQARVRRPAVLRARRAAALRDPGQHALVALAAGAGPALGDAGAGRAALGRAPRPLRRRGPAGRRAGRGVVTWASLAPLALPDLPEEIGRRLVEEHLLNEREFLTPVAPPSVAASEPSYEPDGGRGPIRRYWRGPTWVNSAWMVWLGMRRLGYEAEAQRLAEGVIGAVAREGLREYYDPRTGKGLGAKDFAWSALVAELADAATGAARAAEAAAICSGR